LNRTKLFAVAAGAFLLFALIAGAGNFSLSSQLADTKAQLDALADEAGAKAREAESERANAEIALERARAAEAARDSLAAVAKRREAARQLAHSRAQAAVAAAPDTCQPVIEALEADVAATAQLAGSYLQSYNNEVVAHEDTKSALADAQEGLADAQRALAGLAAKAGEIDVPRQSWLEKILPQSSVGCTAGMSPITARADVVCGASLGWRVSL
jgi:chromosome segregation ATPase